MVLKEIVQQEMQKINSDKRGQVQGIVILLALIMVGGVGGMIGLSLYQSTLNAAPLIISSNAQLLAVQNTYIPLFIVGIVAGTAIAGLIYAILLVLGKNR